MYRSELNVESYHYPHRPPSSPLFPYTTLFRSPGMAPHAAARARLAHDAEGRGAGAAVVAVFLPAAPQPRGRARGEPAIRDRKSTRLNSSHVENSYAVFCLKKNSKTSA